MGQTMKPLCTISAILLGFLGFPHVATMSASQRAAATGTGYLKTKVDPGRAGVFADGKYLGPAANFRMGRKYVLPAGEHEIRLSEPRYEEVTRKVTIRAGQTTTLSEHLRPVPLAKPPFGRLRTVGFTKYDAVMVTRTSSVILLRDFS